MAEWLAEDHLAWFVLDVVDELDLDGLYAGYRADGWGHPAHEPSMMLALLLYAYCLGERSSRRIEARCRDDVVARPAWTAWSKRSAHLPRPRALQRAERPGRRSDGAHRIRVG